MVKTFDSGRRSLLTGGTAAAALWISGAGAASATAFTAFRTAIINGAAEDEALATFYRETGYEGIWIHEDDRATERRAALFEALAEAPVHGLPSAGYGIESLLARMQGRLSQRDLGEIEVDLSRLFLRYATSLQTGILDPRRVDPDLVLTVPLRDRIGLLRAISRGQPRRVLRSLAPSSTEYTRLLKEKLRHEELLASDAWAPNVSAAVLKPGESGKAVIELRDRLISMGYLRRTALAKYETELQRGVQMFQQAHGLTPDGVAGEATMAEINRPISYRLASIHVALERERWMNMDLGARHIWVNLTDYSTQIRDNGQVTFQTRSVIGSDRDGRRTPEFSDRMQTMVINPSWHVPRSIVVSEYLPAMRNNPNASSHMRLIDRQGRVVSRAGKDFSGYTASNFPYSLVQPPSPGNALGLVKFLFPNKWNIYLHDTPAKDLFKREVRAFSHGCIRLADPFDFAYAVLEHQSSTPKEDFQTRLNSGRETPIKVTSDLPVHLTYRTAFTSAKGRLAFRRDIYGRDAKIFAALTKAGVAIEPQQS